MKKILVLIFALLSFMQTYASDEMVMCTMDAMQCSDWSWVGRTWPDCQFVCPEVKACTMEYAPVCWNDEKNYENACLAWKVWIKYNTMCLPTKTETQVYSAWNLAISKYISKITDENKKATILERVISRINFIFWNYKAYSLNQNILWYIKDLALNSLQKDIYEKYLKANISNISEVNAVLGWKWYITDITWTGNNIATINYEDGHIAEIIEVEIKVINWKIVTKVIN